ncbi:hypothetical protein BDZ45DRAFT_647964 [Acephala macrosclerotiorum]|nr:hypothetical protein BDZ45DRAFT_647964 [Acephala macrosclerotiorum]
MPRTEQREEEKGHLARSHSQHTLTDSSSIRSFASSSSTLASSPIVQNDIDDIDDDDDNDEKNFGLLSQDPSAEFSSIQHHHHHHHHHQQSWRKTPLTLHGLSSLIFLRLPFAILKPLLPSFIFTSPPRTLHPTSYLDGLRGVAALIVFLDHFVLNWYYVLRNGYLSSPTDVYFLQLPIIRLIFAGRASVGVFFVISGFVLSHKPLKRIRSGDKAAVLSTLSSSVFRRSMRLYIPIFVGTFISMNLAYNQYFTPVPARGEPIPPILPSYEEQVHHWWRYTTELIFPFWAGGIDPNRAYGPPYNGHLWTIPIEFYGSMVVFLTVLATAGARSGGLRMVLIAGVCGWGMKRGRWDIFSFLGGVVLAEWSLMSCAEGKGEEGRLPSHRERPVYTLRKPLNIGLLLLSLYLLSYAGESPSPGIYHLPLVPYTPLIWEPISLGREHFWLSIGSLLLIFTLVNSRTLQRPFETTFAQYLGDISYSLYIVHGMVLFTLGTYMQEKWTGQVGEDQWPESWGYFRAWGMTGVVVMVVGFWAADLFWRFVDQGAVRGGRWVEGAFVGRGRGRGEGR